MRILSERHFLKYIVTDDGVCLGVELRDRSYLLIATAHRLTVRRRHAGDRVVERNAYDIPGILRALDADPPTPDHR